MEMTLTAENSFINLEIPDTKAVRICVSFCMRKCFTDVVQVHSRFYKYAR